MIIEDAIRSRRTLKVIADPNEPWDCPDESLTPRLTELLELAGWAPFHFACHGSHLTAPSDSPVPWRFYAFTAANSRKLLTRLQTEQLPAGNVAGMLAAADATFLVNWLPDPPEPDAGCDAAAAFQSFVGNQRNMEHIAAASAAVQNLLLAATAMGWNNYWSSAGVLRSQTVFQWLQIPMNQVTLGAVFLFPTDTRNATTKTGANRESRGPHEKWAQWVDL